METTTENPKSKDTARRALLVINVILLSIGSCGALIMRLYFIHGGNKEWFTSFLQTAGWPLMTIPLLIAYTRRRHGLQSSSSTKLFFMTPGLLLGSAAIGILTGAVNTMYAYGLARLPVSTTSLIIATQLAFTAGFAFLLVKQKFTSYSINAVVLLTMGAGILALHTSSDRPDNVSSKEYLLGFLMVLGAAALYGLILPSVELMYNKAKQQITYVLVMEIQTVMAVVATLFAAVGMIVNKDFQGIQSEAKAYDLGETKYYVVVAANAIIWQCLFLGVVGVIFCTSSLLSGIIISVLLPVTEILAVIFFKEKFQAEKGVSLALSLWGFVSYFYGEWRLIQRNNEIKKKTAAETNILQTLNPEANV